MELSSDFYEDILGLVSGIVLFVSGIVTSKKREKRLAGKVRVQATIFEVAQNDTDPDDELYYPVLKFMAKEGTWITKRYHIGGPYSKYQEGQRVTVIYNKNTPDKFEIDNLQSKITGLILTVLGAIVIVLSAALMVFYLMIA